MQTFDDLWNQLTTALMLSLKKARDRVDVTGTPGFPSVGRFQGEVLQEFDLDLPGSMQADIRIGQLTPEIEAGRASADLLKKGLDKPHRISYGTVAAVVDTAGRGRRPMQRHDDQVVVPFELFAQPDLGQVRHRKAAMRVQFDQALPAQAQQAGANG